jgi:hypothetical protein
MLKAPERIQTQKRTRRAEVEWPTRYTKAKRSRGLMASPPFWRKRETFLCTPGTCVRASSRGVVRGIRSIGFVSSLVGLRAPGPVKVSEGRQGWRGNDSQHSAMHSRSPG